MPTILGVESTAHTFGIAVVKDGRVLANVRESYTTDKGGIIPIEAARHHRESKERVYSEALLASGIKEKDIDAIAISQGPGLAPCLLVGMGFAKELAKKLGKPIVPVNHCIAHLEIGRMQTPRRGHLRARDPVMLYASGANTQIIAYASGKFRVFGETLDVGIGNFIDKIARHMGLGFPGGPKIEQLALKAKEKDIIELPYSIKGMDVSFSGLQTKIQQLYNKEKDKDNRVKEKLAFSLQETVFAMLVETAERAMAHTGKTELLLGGGVACNKRLQEMCRIMCRERGAKFFVPENQFLVDNAGMIAFLGEIMFKSGVMIKGREIGKLDIKPRQRTDDVEVTWRGNNL